MKVEQGMHLRVDDQDDAAATAAVAAVGPAKGFELLAMDRGAAVTAVARLRVDDDAVYEARHCDDSLAEMDVWAGFQK